MQNLICQPHICNSTIKYTSHAILELFEYWKGNTSTYDWIYQKHSWKLSITNIRTSILIKTKQTLTYVHIRKLKEKKSLFLMRYIYLLPWKWQPTMVKSSQNITHNFSKFIFKFTSQIKLFIQPQSFLRFLNKHCLFVLFNKGLLLKYTLIKTYLPNQHLYSQCFIHLKPAKN